MAKGEELRAAAAFRRGLSRYVRPASCGIAPGSIDCRPIPHGPPGLPVVCERLPPSWTCSPMNAEGVRTTDPGTPGGYLPPSSRAG